MPYIPTEQALNHAIKVVTFSMRRPDEKKRFEDFMRMKKFNSVEEVIKTMRMFFGGSMAWEPKIKEAERALLAHEQYENPNKNSIEFSNLESAIKKHENGDIYYDMTRLRNMFNQLKNNDQIKARTKYSKYFGY